MSWEGLQSSRALISDMKILLIEDDLDLGNGVRIALADQGMELLLLTLLWTMFTGFITYETGNDQAALHEENLYKTALAVADNLAGQPERRHQTLALLDAAATAGYGMGDPILAVSMLVSQDGRYFGPMAAAGLLGTAHPILTRAHPAAALRWGSSEPDHPPSRSKE
eukprot:gene31945-39464_t